MIPVRIVAANKYSTPYFSTNVVISNAIEPVAAEIIQDDRQQERNNSH